MHRLPHTPWLSALLLLTILASTHARDFTPHRDTFAFANQTLMAYEDGKAGELREVKKDQPPAFKQRCLCMVRGALQFWKFARFDPRAPKLSDDEYRRLLRALFRVAAWRDARPPSERLVFPGYADLWSFSAAHRRLVQEEIGSWFFTYLRPGNWRMAWLPNRWMQGVTARAVARDVRQVPQALYLADFPHVNHGVLAYAAETLADGRIRFRVYDPNYAGQSARLDYIPAHALFDFEKRFYWPGGELRAFRIYRSPLQ